MIKLILFLSHPINLISCPKLAKQASVSPTYPVPITDIFILSENIKMIQLKRIVKRFGPITALDELSFTIKKGEIVGLLGPNGAGKTTTLRIIAGILPPSQGEVLINHQTLSQANGEWKKLIGYLPENNPLYEELTVEEFLKFWARLKGLDKLGQQRAINFVVKSTGLAEVYYRPINELSKGFRQRVGFSQAILTKPEILLLDEPTEGLDPNQRREIRQLIKKLGRHRTVVVSSHILSEVAQIANRIIIIHQGRVVGDDTPENLKHLKTGRVQIEVEIKGQKVLEDLRKLSGIFKVEEISPHRFLLESKEDLRAKIFSLAKDKNWTLLTMFKKELELEEIFSQLTQG